MNLPSSLTKRVNLAESPAVRRWGLAGARRFWLGWAAFTYTILAVISGFGLSALAQASDEGHLRFVLYVAVVLIILAASLLTRLLIRVFAEFHELELSAKQKEETK